MNTFELLVAAEVKRAEKEHGKIHSHHEGLSVLDEEVHEYRAEVWKKRKNRDTKNMVAELVQVAAIAQCIANTLLAEEVRELAKSRRCG